LQRCKSRRKNFAEEFAALQTLSKSFAEGFVTLQTLSKSFLEEFATLQTLSKFFSGGFAGIQTGGVFQFVSQSRHYLTQSSQRVSQSISFANFADSLRPLRLNFMRLSRFF
jgi:hypothetical protein